MNDDVIATKTIAQQIPEQLSQAIAQEMLGKGLEEVRDRFERGSRGSEDIWRVLVEVEKGMDQLQRRKKDN